jgi:hypothetical protein
MGLQREISNLFASALFNGYIDQKDADQYIRLLLIRHNST